MVTKFTSKNIQIFSCESCDFNCSKIGDWNRHIATRKHQNVTNGDGLHQITSDFTCKKCLKKYLSRNGLWSHSKKCVINNNDSLIKTLVDENKTLKEFIVEQNLDFKSMILDVCKNNSNTLISNNNNSNNSNNSNNNNKTFNLQVFLNEECKDAMNIMDFVDSLKLQLSDLENVGKLGFVEGISNIIIKNMKTLDVNKRPVHCSDSKREVMYVKDEGKWYNDTKDEDAQNKKLKKAIKYIANKNLNNLRLFKEKYPDYNNGLSKNSDKYDKLIIEAYGGIGNNTVDNENKIIKRLAKECTICK